MTKFNKYIMRLKHQQVVRAGLVLFWTAAIFMLSSEPASESSARSGRLIEIIDSSDLAGSDSISTFLIRKSAHIFMFFVLGALLYLLMKSFKLSRNKRIGFSILIAAIYGVVDELHQTFVPGRSGELRDVAIDTIGASLGVALCYNIIWLRERREHKI